MDLNNFLNIINMRGLRILSYLSLLAGTIFSGVLIIFRANYQLFLILDIIKLLLLSIAITLPFISLNFLFVAGFYEYFIKDANREDFLDIVLFITGSNTCLLFSISFLLTYLLRYDLKTYKYYIVAGEVLILLYYVIKAKRAERKLKSHQSNNQVQAQG